MISFYRESLMNLMYCLKHYQTVEHSKPFPSMIYLILNEAKNKQEERKEVQLENRSPTFVFYAAFPFLENYSHMSSLLLLSTYLPPAILILICAITICYIFLIKIVP